MLAVIVGIGSTIFSQFTGGFNNPPTIADALTLILAALSLLGLSIFGPGIANGLIAGGPQLERQTGVDDVAAGQPEMEVAAVRPDGLGDLSLDEQVRAVPQPNPRVVGIQFQSALKLSFGSSPVPVPKGVLSESSRFGHPPPKSSRFSRARH